MGFSDLVILTESEKKKTTLIGEFKGGELLQNNNTIYFSQTDHVESHTYSAAYVDYITEWGSTDLRLTPSQKDLVFGNDEARKSPVRCVFKNGKASDYCFLMLTKFPPRMTFFSDYGKPNWYYLSQVVEMSVSPRLVPQTVWSAMLDMEKKKAKVLAKILKLSGNLSDNPHYAGLLEMLPKPVVVRDDKGGVFKFQRIQQLVYHEDVDPSSFQLISSPTSKQIEDARELYISEDPNADRKNTSPPSIHVYIIADSESDATDNYMLNEL